MYLKREENQKQRHEKILSTVAVGKCEKDTASTRLPSRSHLRSHLVLPFKLFKELAIKMIFENKKT